MAGLTLKGYLGLKLFFPLVSAVEILVDWKKSPGLFLFLIFDLFFMSWSYLLIWLTDQSSSNLFCKMFRIPEFKSEILNCHTVDCNNNCYIMLWRGLCYFLTSIVFALTRLPELNKNIFSDHNFFEFNFNWYSWRVAILINLKVSDFNGRLLYGT